MPERRMLIIGTAAAVALLAGGGVYLAARDDAAIADCGTSAGAGGMDAFGTDFTLTRQDGQRVSAAEVFTKPTLLYFGYTFCPDVCPLDSARNASAAAILAERGIDVQTAMVSIDPRRDTPEAMAEFTGQFGGNMIGLTGSEDEIAAVNKGWRNYYKAQDTGDEYYLVDHMTNTYLVLPGNRTVDFFGRDTASQAMADRVACVLESKG